jgi:hypothetical protein
MSALSCYELPLGGDMVVWEINKFKKGKLSNESYGKFSSQKCYIILYSFALPTNSVETFIFFWLGCRSSVIDQSAASMISKIMEESLVDRAIEVRIEESYEPKYFASLFPNKAIEIIDAEVLIPVEELKSSEDAQYLKVYDVINPSKDVLSYRQVSKYVFILYTYYV